MDNYHRQDNTDGYSDEQLAVANERLEAAIAEEGLDTDPASRDASRIQTLAEQTLQSVE